MLSMKINIMNKILHQSFLQPYIHLSNEQEREGRFDRALQILRQALLDPAYGAIKKIITGNIERILRKCAMRARYTCWSIEALYESGLSPNAVGINSVNFEIPPIISLTTISSRVDRVSQTIDCITRQTLKPHSINLYISEEPYLLDQGIQRGNEHLRRIADMGVNIYLTPNIGPYRKQYPLLQQLRGSNISPETLIITLDDDVLYPVNALEQLVSAARMDDAVVAHRGREMVFDGGRLKSYCEFKAPTSIKSQYNLGTGKNGIAYRLKHFPIDLGEYIGPWLAPTADDIWCKWVTGVRGVPTIILEPRAIYDSRFDFSESKPEDKICLYQTFNSTGTNDDAIMNMESFFMFMLYTNFSSAHGG